MTKNPCSHNNLIFIGMPGVGKSTLGVILAKVLNYSFIDSDLVIQKELGMRLKDAIAQQGLEGFNATENRINSQIEATHSIIATGGSAVYGVDAMKHFQEIGTIIYLRISYPNVKRRLGDLDERGVVHKPGQTLLDLYKERTILYEKYADIIIDVDHKKVSTIIDDIIAKL